MTHVLAATLRDAMINRLAGLDLLARRADAAPAAELGNLTSALREILDLHRPDCNGRCRGCTGWPRARRFPCRVWLIVHRHLLVPASPLPNRALGVRDV